MQNVFKSKRVLVTGAGGFIASHLCEALVSAGANVTAMVRYTSSSNLGNLDYLSKDVAAALKLTAGSIEDSEYVMREVEGQDYVFHLAALIAIPYSYVAPRSYVRTNVEGTLNVLEAARRWGTRRVVHTSTSETYGTALYTPIDESHALQGQSPYSASKIAADKIAESYYRSFDLPVATIRPFNTFGPRQSARAVIPTIISQALTRPEVMLGALSPVRDLTYVKDTVQGFMHVAGADQAVGQTINVGTGSGVTIGELARQILELLGMDKPIQEDRARLRPEKSEVFNLICANEKAKVLTGWQPRYSLREGLLETIEFVKQNISRFRPERYTL